AGGHVIAAPVLDRPHQRAAGERAGRLRIGAVQVAAGAEPGGAIGRDGGVGGARAVAAAARPGAAGEAGGSAVAAGRSAGRRPVGEDVLRGAGGTGAAIAAG